MASDCDVNTEWEKRRDAIKQGICTDMLILTTSEDLLLESQAAERSFAKAEEDVVQPDAEITVTNCLLMGANLCAEPLFDQASRESGYGLMLIGDAFIGDQKYLTFVRCVVPFVNWDRNYDALSFGMTTFQEISGRKEQVTRHYYFMDSTPCYEKVYQLSLQAIKQCGRLFRLANKANVGAYGESDDDENSDPMLNTEADEEEAEDIRAELDNVIQKLYAHIVDDKEEYAETSRDVDKFIIDQAASLDLQNSDQKSLACSEYIVPSFVRSGFDPVDFFDRELNRADEFNETCKKLGTKSGLRLIKKGAAKRRKIISLQPRGQAKVVEQASTTATTVLTKYVFEHTAPLLMNSSRPKVRDENRLELPRVKLARSLRTLETTLISLNERFRTESDGKKEMSLYRSATIRHKHDDKQYVINVGDLIALKDAVTFVRVIRIIAYSRNSIVKDVKFHGPVFVHGTQTAIGDQGLPNELFFGYECESFQVVDVDQPVTVHRVPQLTPEEFQSFDSRQMLDRYLKPVAYCAAKECAYKHYFVRQCWVMSIPKFIFDERTLKMVFSDDLNQCLCWKTSKCSTIGHLQLTDDGLIRHLSNKFAIGDVLMFVPNSFRHQKCGDKKPPRFFEKFFDRTLLEKDTEKYASDPIKYPEYDRYKNMVESSEFKEYAFGDTFDIGMVVGADLNEENNVVLALRRFVRPEDTSMSDAEVLKSNRHELYLSGEEYLIIDPYATERLVNRCYVTADRRLSGDRTELKKWLEGGHLRFYCFQTVNESSGDVGGPLNRKDADVLTNSAAKAPSYPRLKNRLRKFDMFSGAGGMSQGLHAAGLTEASYAVEFIKSHAEVYKRNFPSATVFHTDVNVMFERMQRGEKCDASGQRYPQRGDVDLICGGPPCQGFSGMNSAKHEKASTTKRSLVASFLATIDNLRPRLVLMENVSGMAMTVKTGLKDAEKPLEDERAEVLSVVSEALRAIGYQVTVRKLQAALHGVPQDRRRILIMAAAPGEKLPDWPEPTTTCPVNVMKGTADHHTHLKINGKLYRGDRPQLRDYPTSAPYRGATVHEAISDITTDALVVQVTKPTDPSTSPRNHVIPKSHWLQQARVDNVPKATELPYADWRLLPNVKYEMKNGQCTDILKYTHAGIVFSNRAKLVPGRGVCACQHIQKQCTREERSLQKNTLIPAALPHTGSRYQQWAGLFGRPYPHGVFQTIVTVPNPFNKQGQVLHPEQNRLLSVRELARGQGFPDTFKFDSDTTPISVNAQYEQVGNAVPPPLALAIGREIVAALTATAADIAEL